MGLSAPNRIFQKYAWLGDFLDYNKQNTPAFLPLDLYQIDLSDFNLKQKYIFNENILKIKKSCKFTMFFIW